MIAAILSIILNAIAQIFMKRTAIMGLKPIQILTNSNIYFALACYALSILLWLLALKGIKLSTAYPLQSLGYVLVTVLSIFLLDEKVNLGNILGLVLICLGALSLAVSS